MPKGAARVGGREKDERRGFQSQGGGQEGRPVGRSREMPFRRTLDLAVKGRVSCAVSTAIEW